MEDALTIQQVQEIATQAAEQVGSKLEMSEGYITIVGTLLQLLVWGILFFTQRKGHKETQKTATTQLAQSSETADEIKKMIHVNTEALKSLREEVGANSQATVATARSIIKRTYNNLAPNRKINVSDKAMLLELYKAYKAIKLPDGHTPNSFCDAAIQDMETWEVLPDGLLPEEVVKKLQPKKPTRKKK